MENFLQFKSLGRVRDIRDQLAGLCERVEVVIESNPSAGDPVPIQKALTSGYFFNTVCRMPASWLQMLTLSYRHAYTRMEGTERPNQIKQYTSTRHRVCSSINHHRGLSCTTSWSSRARSTCDSVCPSREVGYWNVSTGSHGSLAFKANVCVSRTSCFQQGSNRCGIKQQENAKSTAAGACGTRSMSLLCCLRDVYVSWWLCMTSRTCPVCSEQSDTNLRVHARDHLPCCLFGATELKAEARVGRVQSRASVCGDPRIRVDIQNGVAVSPHRQLHTPTCIATDEHTHHA
jgi:hypothetical protein